jgi:hypothetical protein
MLGLGLGVGLNIKVNISALAKGFVSSNTAEINQSLGANNVSYEVVKESSQVVAGTNHFISLIGHPDNQHYTITLFESLEGGETAITEASKGHGPHMQGHSKLHVEGEVDGHVHGGGHGHCKGHP